MWLAIGHLTTGACAGVTIVGIPLAIANLKMIPVTCFPFGKDIVDARYLPPGRPAAAQHLILGRLIRGATEPAIGWFLWASSSVSTCFSPQP